MMNGKLLVLVFTLVLLSSMISPSESYAGSEGGMVGRKRSNMEQVVAELE